MVWKLNHGKVGQCLGLAADASARDVRGVIWWDWKGQRFLPWKNWTRVGQRIHTPKTNMDTKNPHSWKETIVISCDIILLFCWIFPVNISKLTFCWIELMDQLRVYEHTHTHVISHYPDPWKPFKIGGTSTLQPDMTGDQLPTLQFIGNLGWSFHTNSTFHDLSTLQFHVL